MKKTLVIILALILVLAFTAGCGKVNKVDANDANGAGAVAEEENFKTAGNIDLDIDLGAIKAENMTLDKMNALNDSEGSFRAGAAWNKDTMIMAGK